MGFFNLFNLFRKKTKPKFKKVRRKKTIKRTNDEFVELNEFNNQGDILIHSNVKTKEEFNKVIRYTSSQKNLSKKEIINAISINLRFLEILLSKLENTVYIHEYNKVNDMLDQSKTCIKIMNSISNSQIFYKNTIDIIVKHTVVIGKLVKYINKLERGGSL